MPELSEDTLRIFRNNLPRLKGWRKTVDTEEKTQRTNDILKEWDTRLTSEDGGCQSDEKIVREGSEWRILNDQ